MDWFSVLKNELASKTGFSQLDFDNIVIEDETDCLKRLRELNSKLHRYTVDEQRKGLEGEFSNETRHLFLDEGGTTYNMNVYNEFPDIPEEIACALIEFIQGIKGYKYEKKEGRSQGEYYFHFSEHDYESGRSYLLLFVGVGKKMYRIYFTNIVEEKEKFKVWLSSVV